MPSTFAYRVFLHCRVVSSTKTRETVDGSEIPSNLPCPGMVGKTELQINGIINGPWLLIPWNPTLDGRNPANHLGCKKTLSKLGIKLPTSTGELIPDFSPPRRCLQRVQHPRVSASWRIGSDGARELKGSGSCVLRGWTLGMKNFPYICYYIFRYTQGCQMVPKGCQLS